MDSEELEARLTVIETALVLRLGEDGLDDLRDTIRALSESARPSQPRNRPLPSSGLEEADAHERRLQHMEDRLDLLEELVRRYRRVFPSPGAPTS